MKTKTIQQTIQLRAAPREVYQAIMNSRRHAAFTGMPASISGKAGGKFTIGEDDLIRGRQLELVPDERIVQAWAIAMDGWPLGHESKLTLRLAAVEGGTRLEMTHEGVPVVCAAPVAQGWQAYYWLPLKKYLEDER